MLCEAAAAVTAAQADGRDQLDPELLAQLRRRYDEAVSWGIATNRHRDWPKGNHPGYNLATRLRDKAEQVWTFTRNLAVPWTNYAEDRVMPMSAWRSWSGRWPVGIVRHNQAGLVDAGPSELMEGHWPWTIRAPQGANLPHRSRGRGSAQRTRSLRRPHPDRTHDRAQPA